MSGVTEMPKTLPQVIVDAFEAAGATVGKVEIESARRIVVHYGRAGHDGFFNLSYLTMLGQPGWQIVAADPELPDNGSWEEVQRELRGRQGIMADTE